MGFVTTEKVESAIHERSRIAQWAPELEQRVSDRGLTVAIFQSAWERGEAVPRDYELTARLTMNWEAEKRDHFWAFADLRQARESAALTGVEVGLATERVWLNRHVRRFGRDQKVSSILLALPRSETDLDVIEVPVGRRDSTIPPSNLESAH